MTHSEQINEIAAALAKAQGKIEGALKAAQNPGFKRGNEPSKYADLSAVWDACREHLSANGIAVVQAPRANEQKVTVEMMLCHASGQWIRDELTVTAAASTPQAIGSAITYLRRYTLAAMVGVAPEDDDGNAASGVAAAAGRPEQSRAESVKAKVAAKANGGAKPAPQDSAGRKANVLSRMTALNFDAAKMAEQVQEWVGHPISKESSWTSDDWSRADAGLRLIEEQIEVHARAQHLSDLAHQMGN